MLESVPLVSTMPFGRFIYMSRSMRLCINAFGTSICLQGNLNLQTVARTNQQLLRVAIGEYMVAQSCTMGRKKAPGLYEILGYDGKEQLAARTALQTFNEFKQRGSSPRVPSPGGLISAPASDLGLRRDVVPNDSTLSGTLVLQSVFGKVPEFMQWELFFVACLRIVSPRPL
jgi:hypothetical protein